jgi:phytoene synthase
LLPERARRDTHILYAFFRSADEIVDGDTTPSAADQRDRLDRMRRVARGDRAGEGIPAAFADVRRDNGIPPADVDRFIEAMQTDVDQEPFETFAELRTYMEGSAAAVGRMMARVLGAPDDAEVLRRASALGEAFQLTNFVRDVREDHRQLDRVYLPLQTLRKFGVARGDLEADQASRALRAAVGYELDRALGFYREGVTGIQHLPADCRFPVTLAAILYADHHRLMHEQGLDVLAQRPTLSRRRKLWLAAKARGLRPLSDGPVDLFERASAVDLPEDDESLRVTVVDPARH